MASSKASISINNQRQHTNIPESVSSAFHTPALRAHVFQRTGWSQSTFNMVDWDLTQSYMASITDHQRTNAVKYLHDWQNTRSQNLKFQASEIEKPDTHKTYTESHTDCPFIAVHLRHHSITCTAPPFLLGNPPPPSSLQYKPP